MNPLTAAELHHKLDGINRERLRLSEKEATTEATLLAAEALINLLTIVEQLLADLSQPIWTIDVPTEDN